ncbi:MAG: biotin synthase BioB [Pseudomonadota bacterium]|nr:biotin synthase BioB [Pseudomonadota bacterium]
MTTPSILSDSGDATRNDWTTMEVRALIAAPLNDLLYAAQTVHRRHFDANEVQVSTLLSIKTGGCPEDCAYCSQSAHNKADVGAEKLMSLEAVRAAALRAKDSGATRFCMGAAWRGPKDRDLEVVCDMISEVKSIGLESCVTLGMLEDGQAERLKAAGLDYYNHNIDTSESFYGDIISTRSFDDRLDTLARVRDAGINVCCGGILGMGETRNDRADMLQSLASLPEHPESVPLNMLVAVPGTPLADVHPLDPLELVRAIAVARIVMPKSMVRLSAGRLEMEGATQALCFLAGANSIFYGDTLLTTGNPSQYTDQALFEKLGVRPMPTDTQPAE